VEPASSCKRGITLTTLVPRHFPG